MSGQVTLFVVDDDSAVRTALGRSLRAAGWTVETYDSAESFLARPDPTDGGCLILDVTMPGLDGLALQRQLADAGAALPVVFLTGAGDIPMSVRAMKAGAADFLTKPVSTEVLLDAVRAAIDHMKTAIATRTEVETIRQRFDALTLREREVLAALVQGRLNKQIAGELGIVEQTVKFHRARIMERMQARTIAELMHMAARLGI